MLNPTEPNCGILYVDDEDKALKYFRMALSGKFPIFTASSAEEGLELLRRESASIGIVVSDQRMPGTLGAEFLASVRREFPEIVRILTTAYSDLESAIQAVNRGHIYQYVVKPWEIADLGMVLTRAADYFRILRERNELMALKMTTLQRLLAADRVKWLLLHGRALPNEGRSAYYRALASLVTAMPADLQAAVAGSPSARAFEIGALIRDEHGNAARVLDWMTSLEGAGTGILPVAGAAQALAASLSAIEGISSERVAVKASSPAYCEIDLGPVAGDAVPRQLFGLLVARATPEVSVRLLEAIVAAAREGGTLALSMEKAGVPLKIEFSPASESDTAEGVIDALSEKIAAADIASR